MSLATPHDFYGVSVFYEDFAQVSDAAAAVLLKAPPAASRRAA